MNNYQKHQKQMSELKGRPTLLIHICCGVCSVYPLTYLREHFDVTIYFANSNIYPYDEYLKRLNALEKYVDTLNDDSIRIIKAPYRNREFTEKIARFAKEPEGGRRCALCYALRMKETFDYASANGYDYCTTVMSISNRKNADYINIIGEKLDNRYPNVRYLYADFKKGNGITVNEKMNKELNLYHQNYCGCIFSLRD